MIGSLLDALVRNWAFVAISTTITLLIVLPTLIILKYVRISLNLMRTTRPPLARDPLDYERVAGTVVTFPAYDGLPLQGMLLPPSSAGSARGLIVFAHEFCADMYSHARYCKPLLAAGYEVLTFDFRGHGSSPCEPEYTPRQWVTNRDLNDMRGAVAFASSVLEERGAPPRIGLFGISRGGCAALLTAAEDERIAAIVVDGVFSTDMTIEYFMQRWAYIFGRVRFVYENHPPVFWRFLRWSMMCCARREFRCTFPSVRKALGRMTPRPTLFIHGERDSYLPMEQAQKLYALAPQPKGLWIAPDARHNQAAILHPERYAQITRRFFDEHLWGGRRNAPAAAASAAAAPAGAHLGALGGAG